MCASYNTDTANSPTKSAFQLPGAVDASDFSIEGEKSLDADQTPSFLATSLRYLQMSWRTSACPRSPNPPNPNSYGYVRSYRNNSNDPQVTRHMLDVCGFEPTYKTVPACDDHYGVLNAPSLGVFQKTSPGHGHGGVDGQCVQGHAQYVKKHRAILFANISDEEILANGV